jgi:hypothetical protein
MCNITISYISYKNNKEDSYGASQYSNTCLLQLSLNWIEPASFGLRVFFRRSIGRHRLFLFNPLRPKAVTVPALTGCCLKQHMAQRKAAVQVNRGTRFQINMKDRIEDD